MPILLLIAALGLGLAAWKYPVQALSWMPLLLPAYLVRTSIGPLPTTALELGLVAIAIGVTFNKGLRIWKDGWDKIEPWHTAIITWTLATIIAIFVASNHVAALGLWRAYILEPIAFFVLAAAVLDTASLRILARSLVLTTIGIAAWCFVQYMTGRGIPHPWDTSFLTRRATGPFPYPNAVALFCAPVAALCLGAIVWKNDLLDRNWAWIGFVAGFAATLMAHSAGGTIAILVSLLFALVLNKKTRKIGLSVIALAIIAYVFAPSSLSAPLTKLLSFHDWSGYVRLKMWQDTWRMLRAHPVFGAGFGGYPALFKQYQTTTGIEIFQYPHNILLNLWSETGLLGIGGFILIVMTWIHFGKMRPWTLMPLVAILVHGLVDVPYFKNDLAIAFWMFALLASLPLLNKRALHSMESS